MASAPLGDLGPLPVTSADPASGNADALVTLVVFGDFQCPFCAKSAATLGELRRKYSDADLRIIWKNNPLPFHERALPAAEVAMAVFEARGAGAFWQFHDGAFADQQALGDTDLIRIAEAVGLPKQDLVRVLDKEQVTRKIQADIALASSLQATGTPSFFANGSSLSGAQPLERFVALVDAELARSRGALAAGVPRQSLYASLTRTSIALTLEEKRRAREAAATPEGPEITEPQVVSIAGAPVRGPATAPVTIVEFSEFQCPYCARVQPALQEIMKRHPGKVRIVWRNQPLPFHPRAEPMAQTAMEAFDQRGNDGFWKVHNALWSTHPAAHPPSAGGFQKSPSSVPAAAAPKWEDADLIALAVRAGVSGARVKSAIQTHRHKATLDSDAAAAKSLGAQGTPTFFINGRKLVGAQPFERFEEIVLEELARTRALIAQGIPPASLYDHLQKTAKPPTP